MAQQRQSVCVDNTNTDMVKRQKWIELARQCDVQVQYSIYYIILLYYNILYHTIYYTILYYAILYNLHFSMLCYATVYCMNYCIILTLSIIYCMYCLLYFLSTTIDSCSVFTNPQRGV